MRAMVLPCYGCVCLSNLFDNSRLCVRDCACVVDTQPPHLSQNPPSMLAKPSILVRGRNVHGGRHRWWHLVHVQ